MAKEMFPSATFITIPDGFSSDRPEKERNKRLFAPHILGRFSVAHLVLSAIVIVTQVCTEISHPYFKNPKSSLCFLVCPRHKW